MPVLEMDNLKARLAGYGLFVQGMIEKSRQALVAECTSLIARHQPMARDLRTILMVLGITNDLERIADHAVNIAEAVGDHIGGPSLKPGGFTTEDAALKIAGNLERIADLSTNIGEDVIYMTEGRVIKHHLEEEG